MNAVNYRLQNFNKSVSKSNILIGLSLHFMCLIRPFLDDMYFTVNSFMLVSQMAFQSLSNIRLPRLLIKNIGL